MKNLFATNSPFLEHPRAQPQSQNPTNRNPIPNLPLTAETKKLSLKAWGGGRKEGYSIGKAEAKK